MKKTMMRQMLFPALATLLAIPAVAQAPAGIDPGSLGHNDPMPIRPDYMRTRAVISPTWRVASTSRAAEKAMA